jgi:hypothetical protein
MLDARYDNHHFRMLNRLSLAARQRRFATAKVDDLVWALIRTDEQTDLSFRALAPPLRLLLSA